MTTEQKRGFDPEALEDLIERHASRADTPKWLTKALEVLVERAESFGVEHETEETEFIYPH